jgi:excisionase family DNA binding protein
MRDEMDTTNKISRETLSIPEAGKALGIGRSAAYEAARTGQLPSIRIGKRLLVPIVALERLLEQAVTQPES